MPFKYKVPPRTESELDTLFRWLRREVERLAEQMADDVEDATGERPKYDLKEFDAIITSIRAAKCLPQTPNGQTAKSNPDCFDAFMVDGLLNIVERYMMTAGGTRHNPDCDPVSAADLMVATWACREEQMRRGYKPQPLREKI